MCHISRVEAKNFKHFDHIEVKDIGQFNLIVGDNNVGKTSLLELLTVEESYLETLRNWYKCMNNRGLDFEISYVSKKYSKGSEQFYKKVPKESWLLKIMRFGQTLELHFGINKGTDLQNQTNNYNHEFDLKDQRGISVVNGETNEALLAFDDKICDEDNHFPLNWVGIHPKSDSQLDSDFVSLTKGNDILERKFAENLAALLPNISGFKSLSYSENRTLGIVLAPGTDAQPLSVFGSGTTRLMEILIALHKAKDCRLFIDEIDTGIHHSRRPEFLKTILKIAEELKVQLFMTTHNMECEEAFLSVLNDDKKESEKFRAISLYRNAQTGQIMNSVRDFGGFAYSLKSGHDIRM
jgi:AAA15 family ATPase/GTPase